jgi:threonine dehydratase
MSAGRLSREAIRSGYQKICKHIRRTPVIEVDGGDFGIPEITLVFKLEFLQHAGSFKTRGAFTHLLDGDTTEAGVVAASGGNHGAATAYAAMKLGQKATIFVPSVASAAKLEQIRQYGADLRIVGDRYADALAASQDWAAGNGARVIHAYDQPETLLGQGSVALEFGDQAPALDAVLVAVGGGGLIGGMAAWFRGEVPLIAVEPEASPTLTFALQAGQPVDAPAGGLAADSLAPKRVGELMFPLARDFIRQTVLVSDDDITRAQHTLWKQLRIVTEPGGATAFAALLSGRFLVHASQRIGVLLCGANSTAVHFPNPLKDTP